MTDPNELLRQAKAALDKVTERERMRKNDEDRKFLASTIGKDLADTLSPTLEKIADNSRVMRDEFKAAIEGIQVTIPNITVPKAEVTVTVPDIKMPKIELPIIKIPVIKVPRPEVTVKIPEIKIPKIEIPEQQISFPEQMTVRADEVIPVILTDNKGKRYSISEFMAGGGGGKIADKKRSDTARAESASIATTSTQIVPSSINRKSVIFTHEAADSVYFGTTTNVTTANGFPVVANQIYGFDDYTGPVYAIISNGAAASTISVRFIEV